MMIINQIQLVVVLLAAMVALALLAHRFSVPPPLILVPAGVILGFIPWFPRIELNPDLVLFVFLPPLVYTGAVSSWHAVRNNLKPILLLSIGLVLFTMGITAVVAHYSIPGFEWPLAFVLAAVIAPTDDVAAAMVVRDLSLPHRLVSILEWEGLLNDATALTAFRFATAAVALESFPMGSAALTFLMVIVGEIGYGLCLGWIVSKLRRKVQDLPIALTISFLTPFLAYLPAERLGGSGVLATAVTGLYIGSQSSVIFTPGVRIVGYPIWKSLGFIFNSILFLVTGLQLKSVWNQVSHFPPGDLLYYGALISGVVILARILWIYPVTFLPQALSPRLRTHGPAPAPRHLFILSWSGMRGSISLAAAFGIPVLTTLDTPFPQRALIIFITFCVILSTLVLQGVSLPWLIRRLGVDRDGAREKKGAHYQEAEARIEAAKAAIDEISSWEKEGVCTIDMARHLRNHYEKELKRLDRHLDEARENRFARLSKEETELQLKVLNTERSKILELGENGVITNETLRLIELDLDLQEVRLKENAHPE